MNVINRLDREAADDRFWRLGVGGKQYRSVILDAMEDCVIHDAEDVNR